MKRRGFLGLLGSTAITWPLAAFAQQSGTMRRIGVLINLSADDPEGQARVAAFLQGLQEAGWAVGRNAQVDIRWGMGDAERIRKNVTELVALAPDVILANTFPLVAALQQATRTVPTVTPPKRGFAFWRPVSRGLFAPNQSSVRHPTDRVVQIRTVIR